MDKEAQKLVQKVLTQHQEVRLAYLIGSVSKGSQRRDSDLDLVLVVEDEDLDKFDYGQVYLELDQVIAHPNLDLRVVIPDQVDLIYLHQVINGDLIYAQDEKYRVNFEKKVMIRYFDTQHIRDIFHYYLDKSIEKGTYGR